MILTCEQTTSGGSADGVGAVELSELQSIHCKTVNVYNDQEQTHPSKLQLTHWPHMWHTGGGGILSMVQLASYPSYWWFQTRAKPYVPLSHWVSRLQCNYITSLVIWGWPVRLYADLCAYLE